MTTRWGNAANLHANGGSGAAAVAARLAPPAQRVAGRRIPQTLPRGRLAWHLVLLAALIAYPWVATPFFTFQIGGQALALG